VGVIGRLRRRRKPRVVVAPLSEFHADHYLRHNQRRLEHLATLGLPLAGRSVIEVGAGIGDHTGFFLDRGCSVIATDGRTENVELLRRRFPTLEVSRLDLDDPDPAFGHSAEIVFCYGTLYHLREPARALAFLAKRCSTLMLVETCVSFGDDDRVDFVDENSALPSQALHGLGARPTRVWVRRRLAELFPFVYLPTTQPWHPEFPVDWTQQSLSASGLARAIFVASRIRIDNPLLTQQLEMHQKHV